MHELETVSGGSIYTTIMELGLKSHNDEPSGV